MAVSGFKHRVSRRKRRSLEACLLLVLCLCLHSCSHQGNTWASLRHRSSKSFSRHVQQLSQGNGKGRVAQLSSGVDASRCVVRRSTGSNGVESFESNRVQRTLSIICLIVFLQMLSEGIAISSIPLHAMRFGATPVLVGVITSCFSLTQMLGCPFITSIASRVGYATILRVCLFGAACSALIVTFSQSLIGIIIGRALAGCFAASVPVAQAAVTDIVPSDRTPLALSRVTAASQMGIVVGPAISAILQSVFEKIGLSPDLQVRAVFGSFSIVLCVFLVISQVGMKSEASRQSRKQESGTPEKSEHQEARSIQLLLRMISGLISWTLVLSVSTYTVFSNQLMGYHQQQVSLTLSCGAAVAVLTQLFVFPRVVKALGANKTCATGLVLTSAGLGGLSCFLMQPLHMILYTLNRIGIGIADTSNASLVAMSSASSESRARNLALLQSTRAFTRLFTPILGGRMLELSMQSKFAPGALPYLTAASLALVLSYVPLSILKKGRRI
eukprot:TRINITY_DN51042_c0_g1_i1.p1 TRINITY_DN51042_c0_g1~~TRINITY_DN51042_c0_g1_i1.p1  ORF type:complete len:500 (-),score=45.67 TRINITY_DN51042_c0_g1_i1:72-1571(-)